MSNTSHLCLSVCRSCAVCFTCSGYAEGRQRESQPKQSFYSCHVSTSVSFLCPDLSWSVSWREQKELKRIGAASVQPAHTRVMGWGMLILPTCLPQHWGMGEEMFWNNLLNPNCFPSYSSPLRRLQELDCDRAVCKLLQKNAYIYV